MRHAIPALAFALAAGPLTQATPVWSTTAWAADDVTHLETTIKDHRFEPAEIHVPAGKPAMLVIHNADATAEEFESAALKVEKVAAGNATITVRLRPLAPGRFPFIGEYHAATAHGDIVADPATTP